ncbi:hypothetical protein Tco_0045276, partial [Tanacetum coccineum]
REIEPNRSLYRAVCFETFRYREQASMEILSVLTDQEEQAKNGRWRHLRSIETDSPTHPMLTLNASK